jgi:hypothetical protein
MFLSFTVIIRCLQKQNVSMFIINLHERGKQNVSMFIINLHDTMDPLLIVMSYKKMLHKIMIFKDTKLVVKHSKTCLKLMLSLDLLLIGFFVDEI